jgi:hypothetical protein
MKNLNIFKAIKFRNNEFTSLVKFSQAINTVKGLFSINYHKIKSLNIQIDMN